MSFAKKMDVLDLVIETLKEHERALDDLAHRLEAFLEGAPKGGPAGIETPGDGFPLDDWR